MKFHPKLYPKTLTVMVDFTQRFLVMIIHAISQ